MTSFRYVFFINRMLIIQPNTHTLCTFMFGQIINTLLILNVQQNGVTQDATGDVRTLRPSSYFRIIQVSDDVCWFRCPDMKETSSYIWVNNCFYFLYLFNFFMVSPKQVKRVTNSVCPKITFICTAFSHNA